MEKQTNLVSFCPITQLYRRIPLVPFRPITQEEREESLIKEFVKREIINYMMYGRFGLKMNDATGELTYDKENK